MGLDVKEYALNQDLAFCLVQLRDNGLTTASMWTEVYLDWSIIED